MAEPYRDTPSGTVAKSRKTGDDQDLDTKVDVVEVSGKEAEAGSSANQFDTPLGRRLSPVDDLKHRLSLWGESNTRSGDSDEEGSEYELLLDPNLPEEYSRPAVPSINSGLDDVEKSKMYTEEGEEEDSPYPEVRAACHNYDIEAPCNTVGLLPAACDEDLLMKTTLDSCMDNRNVSCHCGRFDEHVVLPTKPFHRTRCSNRTDHRLADWARLGQDHAD